jgi:uncharacterized membrane protein YdfJ with MMPL/SSD domain
MAIARYGMLKTMGPLLALSVFITLLAALTLAPSLATAAESIFIGRTVNLPNPPLKKTDSPGNLSSRGSPACPQGSQGGFSS